MIANFEKNYDVAVVGGGIAGAAAALAAARAGRKTVLFEKTVLLGGLATSGLVYFYLPLCDGNGTQVTFGIGEELIKLSLKYGPGDIPAPWNKNASATDRYYCFFSPAAFMLALDEVLQEAGVDIWFDTLVCDVQVNSANRLEAIAVENESGRGTVKAKCFIDASGSGIVARRAGAPVSDEDNYYAIWALEYELNSQKGPQLAKDIPMYIWGNLPCNEKNPPTVRGLDGRKVSNFVLDGRKVLRDHYQEKYASGEADRKTLFPLKLPVMPQFRKLFAVNGKKTLNSGQHATYFEDSIGLVADWRKPGYVWEIPYGTLVPEKTGGLLTAGRCISSIGDAWEVTRVIPAAALTGEAAGTAAALAVEKGVMPSELNVSELQEKLKTAGFPLHLKDAGL
ncbi:MAG: FAD-dependent oxidoreductase [Victivallales bacterium]|nr:FAD-dependent oxidoreductase [Victivallales bacterium]